MADPENLPTEEKVRRGVARTILNTTTVLIALGVLGVWVATGYYELEPGRAGVILRFGEFDRVVTTPGPKLHLPPPIEMHTIVNVEEISRDQFGVPSADGVREGNELREASIQTKANNIVHLEFAVQYRFRDAFEARFRVAEPREILRDAAQAALREVVGRTELDDVIAAGKGPIATETRELLQRFLDEYETGIEVTRVQLIDVQPPPAVRDAFDDVIAAAQDRDRKVQEARGYENEVLPGARAEAQELVSSAEAYEVARVAEASGDAARFLAVLAEYQRAPRVTRERLYIETMEEILPEIETILIDPGAAGVLPHLPLGGDRRGAQP